MNPRWRLLLLPAATAVTAVLVAAPALIANLIESGLGHDRRLVPGVGHVTVPLALLSVLTPFVLIALLFTVGKAALQPRTLRFRVIYAAGTVLGQFALTAALLATMVVTDPGFLGPDLAAQQRSPTGARTAYLYKGAMMCGLEVYVAEDGAWTMKQERSLPVRCEDQDSAVLVWTSALEVRVVNAH